MKKNFFCLFLLPQDALKMALNCVCVVVVVGCCAFLHKPQEAMHMWEARSPLLEACGNHAKNTSKLPSVSSMVQKSAPF